MKCAVQLVFKSILRTDCNLISISLFPHFLQTISRKILSEIVHDASSVWDKKQPYSLYRRKIGNNIHAVKRIGPYLTIVHSYRLKKKTKDYIIYLILTDCQHNTRHFLSYQQKQLQIVENTDVTLTKDCLQNTRANPHFRNSQEFFLFNV